jgi:uncharacterized protein (UPF0276 family)
VLIEWDDDIPTWEVLDAEATQARRIRDEVCAARATVRIDAHADGTALP